MRTSQILRQEKRLFIVMGLKRLHYGLRSGIGIGLRADGHRKREPKQDRKRKKPCGSS